MSDTGKKIILLTVAVVFSLGAVEIVLRVIGYGVITPEMQQVVDGVKTILFGEAGQVIELAGPPTGAADDSYQSPLEW